MGTPKINRVLTAGREFDMLNNILCLPRSVKREVMRLYWELINFGKSQGIFTDRAIGALTYYVCKRDGYTVSMKEIARALDTDKYSLFRTYKTVTKSLRLSVVALQMSGLITRYSNNLGLSGKTISEAIRKIELIEKMGLNNDPMVLAAVVLYDTAKKNKEKISMSKVTKEFGICESSLIAVKRKVSKLLF